MIDHCKLLEAALEIGERAHGGARAAGRADHSGRAAIGTLLTSNPMHIIKAVMSGLLGIMKGSPFGKARYLNTLKMMHQFMNKVRKEGLLSVEMDVEKPRESSIFKNYPEFLNDHHALEFVCDTLRMAITGASGTTSNTRPPAAKPDLLDQVKSLFGGRKK